ncbi:hypothetical protein GCM10023225_34130 [Kineococcus glutinatus]|uniref:Uncharacterized protein n=1 Tax=Kineococcus glutinatus TaxID=1070872 RepID=A0ABP8VF74_9ACTN
MMREHPCDHNQDASAAGPGPRVPRRTGDRAGAHPVRRGGGVGGLRARGRRASDCGPIVGRERLEPV